MKITDSGFHNISEVEESSIVISSWVQAVFFDNNSKVSEIILEENAQLKYFGYFWEENTFNKHIITKGEKSSAKINCFLLAQENKKITSKVFGEVAASESKIDTDIIALAKNEGSIDIDGIIQINNGVEKVEWYLNETNIFLWDKWSVRGFPTLLVRSNDVQAGHGCNIEKISDEKLFYLRSRWIWKENALTMMVISYIETIFGDLQKYDQDFHDTLVSQIINDI